MTQSSVVDAAERRKSSDAASEVDPWDLVDEEDDVIKWSGNCSAIRHFTSVTELAELQTELNTEVRKQC